MKKRNLVIHTAIASALLTLVAGAHAGNVGVSNRSFAVEQFLGSTPTVTALSLAPIASQFASPVSNQTLYVYVQLTGGATFGTTPAVTDLTGTYGDSSAITQIAGPPAAGVTAVAVSTDKTFVVFTLVMNTGKTFNSASVLSYTPAAGAVVTANGALGTVGGSISANFLTDTTLSSATVPAGNVDSVGTRSGIVATSVQGISLTAAASSSFPFNNGGVPETARINLGASPISTALTTNVNASPSTTLLNLGAVRIAQNPIAVTNIGTAYTLAGQQASTTALTYAVSAPAGFFAALGTSGTVSLSTTANCTTTVATSTSAVFSSAAAAAAATVVTVAGATLPVFVAPANGANYFVCMAFNGSTAIVPGTPVVTATVAHTATATDSNNTLASTNLYALITNGSTRDVRSYIPAVTVGYTSFVRVINTGVIAAPVTGQWLYENGSSSTPSLLISSHPVGGAVTLNSTQIEALLGVPAAIGNNRPRLRLTAPTNGMEAQSFFLTNANGTFSDATGAQ